MMTSPRPYSARTESFLSISQFPHPPPSLNKFWHPEGIVQGSYQKHNNHKAEEPILCGTGQVAEYKILEMISWSGKIPLNGPQLSLHFLRDQRSFQPILWIFRWGNASVWIQPLHFPATFCKFIFNGIRKDPAVDPYAQPFGVSCSSW